MKYAEIVFLQDSEANEALEILEKEGEENTFKYLCQWDYGDSPIEERNDELWGEHDEIFKMANYVMSYNTSIGYIGLIKILDK